jgi:hypothetical protein
VAPKTHTLTIRMEGEMIAAMQALQDERGIPVSEQVRRAVRAWLVAEKRWPATPSERKKSAGK